MCVFYLPGCIVVKHTFMSSKQHFQVLHTKLGLLANFQITVFYADSFVVNTAPQEPEGHCFAHGLKNMNSA